MTGYGYKTMSREWPYELTLKDIHGNIALQTRHRTKSSYDVEVQAAKSRGFIIEENLGEKS